MSKTKKNLTYLKRMIEEQLKTVLKEQSRSIEVKVAPGAQEARTEAKNNLMILQAKLGARTGARPQGAANMFQGAPEQNFDTLLKIQQFIAYLDSLQFAPYGPDMPRVPPEGAEIQEQSAASARRLPPNAPSPANQTDDIYRRISSNLERIQKLENKGESVKRILETTLESLNIIKTDLKARGTTG